MCSSLFCFVFCCCVWGTDAIKAFVQREITIDRHGTEMVMSGQDLATYDELTQLRSQINLCTVISVHESPELRPNRRLSRFLYVK